MLVELRCASSEVIDRPPALLLTLSDLDQRAAASQTADTGAAGLQCRVRAVDEPGVLGGDAGEAGVGVALQGLDAMVTKSTPRSARAMSSVSWSQNARSPTADLIPTVGLTFSEGRPAAPAAALGGRQVVRVL